MSWHRRGHARKASGGVGRGSCCINDGFGMATGSHLARAIREVFSDPTGSSGLGPVRVTAVEQQHRRSSDAIHRKALSHHRLPPSPSDRVPSHVKQTHQLETPRFTDRKYPARKPQIPKNYSYPPTQQTLPAQQSKPPQNYCRKTQTVKKIKTNPKTHHPARPSPSHRRKKDIPTKQPSSPHTAQQALQTSSRHTIPDRRRGNLTTRPRVRAPPCQKHDEPPRGTARRPRRQGGEARRGTGGGSKARRQVCPMRVRSGGGAGACGGVEGGGADAWCCG